MFNINMPIVGYINVYMYTLCIHYVYIMYTLCIHYVYIMYTLCIHYDIIYCNAIVYTIYILISDAGFILNMYTYIYIYM